MGGIGEREGVEVGKGMRQHLSSQIQLYLNI